MENRENDSEDLIPTETSEEPDQRQKRMAWSLDIAVGLLITLPLWLMGIITSGGEGWFGFGVVLAVGYFIVEMVLWRTRGQTVGRLILKQSRAEEPRNNLASPWERLAAYMIDAAIFMVVVAPFWLALLFEVWQMIDDFIAGYSVSNPLTPGVALILVVGLAYVILQMALLAIRGQTVGKIVMRIRIVDVQDGTHPGGGRLILLRYFANAVVIGIPVIGFVYFVIDACCVFRRDHRTIHDHFSETQVVRV